MTDEPVRRPDKRSLLFAGDTDEAGRPLPMGHDVLIARTTRWPVTAATPSGVAGLLSRDRQLYVDGLYTYENFADSAAKSLQAVEAALKARTGAKSSFKSLIDSAHTRGLVSDDERDFLHAGRKLRNRLIHADGPTIWTPALAAEIVAASHRVVSGFFPDHRQ